jgi:drug/metabolite transporter (DMT)-like permease
MAVQHCRRCTGSTGSSGLGFLLRRRRMARGLAAFWTLCNEPSRRSGLPGPPAARLRKTKVPSFLRSQAAAYLLLPLACACWAGNHVIARMIAGHAPPASISLARWIVVFLVVSLFAWRQIRGDWAKLAAKVDVLTFLALIGGAAFGTLQFVALQYTTALNMGVVGSVSPAFIVAASYILFGDRLGPSQLFGVAISLLGVLAIVTQLHPERLLSLSFNGGDLIIIVNMMFWAVYCACLRLRPSVHPMSFLFAIAYVSALANAPFAAWEYMTGANLVPDVLTVSAVLYAAVFTSVLAYVAWNRGIDLIGAPRASAFLHTIPLFSAVLATSLLGERLMLFHIVGFVLILAGVTLAARPSREEPARAMVGEGPA